MSYESKLAPQPSKLINPAQLCLLLSVVFHLLILRFGLPSIKFNNDSGRREVSVIELDSEQQARLPDLYPQLPAPEPSNLDNLPQPDANSPAVPFAIPPGLIPGITDPSQLPPLTIPPPPKFNLPPIPPITDITLPPVGDISELPAPPAIDPLDFQVEPVKLPPNLGKVPKAAESDVPKSNVEPQPIETPVNEVAKASPQAPRPLDRPVSPQAVSPPIEKQPKPQPTKEQQAAQKVTESQQRLRKLTQSLTKNEAGTTDEDARKNYVAWLGKVENIEPGKVEIVGSYPRDACIRRLKGNSIFGAVVNAQGKVVALDLIKGAQYPIFNQQGGKDLNARTFDNPTGQPKPLQVTVKYEYDADICPSLTLPSIRRAEEKQQTPKIEKPNPESAPKPASEKPTSEPTSKPPSKKPNSQQPETQSLPTARPDIEKQPLPPEKLPSQESSKPAPETNPANVPNSKPPVVKPPALPSLREQLRDVPLPELKPSQLKDIPLPENPNLNRSN